MDAETAVTYVTPPLGNLAAALSAAQGEIGIVEKDRENPFFKSSYATLDAVIKATKAPLSKHGLAVVQTTEIGPEGRVMLRTSLIHKSGEKVESVYPIVPIKNDPQGYGSAITYARRYCLSAIVGVAPAEDDDDGNEASKPSRPAPARDGQVASGHAKSTSGAPIAQVVTKEMAEVFLSFLEQVHDKGDWKTWVALNGEQLRTMLASLPDGELKERIRNVANDKRKAYA